MAWQGKIVSFSAGSSNGWEVGVEYYNDTNPSVTFFRMLQLPDDATKAQAISLIQARGDEVRSKAKLSDDKLIGQIVQIP